MRSIIFTIHWKNHSWKQLSLIGDETVINLQRTKVYVFSDSVLCFGKIHQHPDSNEARKIRIEWITIDESYRDYDGINGVPTEFEWNIFPGFTTLQLCGQVNDLLSDFGETPETFTGRILSLMSMFNDISCDGKVITKNVLQMPESSKYLQKDLVLDNGHLLVQVVTRGGVLRKGIARKEFWDHIVAKMLLDFEESGCPIFRGTTPLSRRNPKSKGHGKLSIHYCADQKTIETISRIIAFANQFSLYGAVANMCEEFEFHQHRSGQPYVLMGQSIVLNEIKAKVSLQKAIPSHQNVLLQHEERTKLL